MTPTPFRFSEEVLASSEFLPPGGESIGPHLEARRLIRARRSPLFNSAAESLDAAVGLLVLDQVSQAYLLFAQALEVTLKGVLDEVRELGFEAWLRQNPGPWPNRPERCPLHPWQLKETIKEKTFPKAFQEVAELGLFSESARRAFEPIPGTRNRIAHSGGEDERCHIYVQDILTRILPLLDELYRAHGLHLADLLLHCVARELLVAGRFLRRRRDGAKSWAMALRPVTAAYFHRINIEHGAPADFDPFGYGWGDRFDMNHEWEKVVAGSLKGNVLDRERTRCHICGERCFVATDGELRTLDSEEFFRVASLACPYCHLRIPEEYSDLAELHYGRITEESLGAEQWAFLRRDFGYQDEEAKA
jgi:hypothetical protein